MRYSPEDFGLAKPYSNLREVITSILNILDNNNMYVDYTIAFNAIFPDIFITKLDYYDHNVELAIPQQYAYNPYKYRQPGLNKRGDKFYVGEDDKVYRV